MSAVRQIICWVNSINWTPEAITAASTVVLAFLTLVLAAGTLFLWLATKRLVRGSEKTAERQLRAYVHVTDAIILHANSEWPTNIRVQFKNYGQTGIPFTPLPRAQGRENPALGGKLTKKALA